MFIIIFYDGSVNLIEEIDEDCLFELEQDKPDLTNPDELKTLKKVIENNPMWADMVKI